MPNRLLQEIGHSEEWGFLIDACMDSEEQHDLFWRLTYLTSSRPKSGCILIPEDASEKPFPIGNHLVGSQFSKG